MKRSQLRLPFRLTPSPAQYVGTPVHSSALAQLRYSRAAGHGLTLLDGPEGTGKTILALTFLREADAEATPIYLPHSRFDSAADLLRTLLHDLDCETCSAGESELRRRLHETLLERARAGRPGLLALDDAHELGYAALEELRRFDNLAAGGTPALAILLVADLTLRDRLPASLASRIGLHARLAALAEEDAARFVKDQLTAAERPGDAFSGEALALIAAESRGVPRAINRIASLALALAQDAGEECVDVEAVLEALARLAPPEAATIQLSKPKPRKRKAA